MISDFFAMAIYGSPILIPILIVMAILGDSEHPIIYLPLWILFWCLYVLFFPFQLDIIINKIISPYFSWQGTLLWIAYAIIAIWLTSDNGGQQEEIRVQKEYMFEEVKQKIQSLNNDLLDPDRCPSYFTAKECSEIGMLCIKLDAIVNDLKASGGSESSIKKALEEIANIEQRAKEIHREIN